MSGKGKGSPYLYTVPLPVYQHWVRSWSRS